MPLTLYAVSDGPPSLAVRQALKYLNLEYELKNIDYVNCEHMTPEFAEKNPQMEIPVLDDNGFILGESNAILQYLAEKYPKDDKLYPTDPQARAIVNHRLCFNLSTYYKNILEYAVLPIFFDYERTSLALTKLRIGLKHFNTYLKKLGTKYSAGDYVTIADFQFVTATMCLEAINFDISAYPAVQEWYSRYKKENVQLWQIAEQGMKELAEFAKNPPDLSKINHPIHPIRTPK